MTRYAGAAVSLTARQKILAQEVSALLRSGELTTVNDFCICTNSPDTLSNETVIAQVDRYGLDLQSVVCGSCGTVRANPYLNEASLNRFYSTYYQDLYDRASDPDVYFDAQKKYGERLRNAIRDLAPKARTVVEVGCGAGGALAILKDAGMNVFGCDHSERLIEFGQTRNLNQLAVGDITRLLESFPTFKTADVVYLHHVFEHICHPRDFLLSCRSIINRSGILIAIVPDISRIDAFPFPGGDIRLFLHLAHKFNYSKQGLAILGQRSGYSVEFINRFESSVAPELWAVFRPIDESEAFQVTPGSGLQMLRYLRRTELRYRLMLLPGYRTASFPRLRRIVKALLPSRALKWLRTLKCKLTATKGAHG